MVDQSVPPAPHGVFASGPTLPYKYPQADKFGEAVQHAYWLHTEVSMGSDVQDFLVKMRGVEKSAIKNCTLAIAQIEVDVKKFWGKIGDRLPRTEFHNTGSVFAESEVRHFKAYKFLLEELHLVHEFGTILDVPAIQGRVKYLGKYLSGASQKSDQDWTLSLALFSLFTENVSLFSQFAIIKSFYRERNMLKNVSNLVQATQQEEALHAQFGAYVINLIRDENPDWFNRNFYARIKTACQKAFEAECGILDWIFEDGELDFLPKATLVEFLKYRFNKSLEMIGAKPQFEVDTAVMSGLMWFIEDEKLETNSDFFHVRPTQYTKRDESFSVESMWDED